MVLSEWYHTCCYITILAVYNILHCANVVWLWYTECIWSGPTSKESDFFSFILNFDLHFIQHLFSVLWLAEWHFWSTGMHCISDIYIIKMYVYLKPEFIIHFHIWKLLNYHKIARLPFLGNDTKWQCISSVHTCNCFFSLSNTEKLFHF